MKEIQLTISLDLCPSCCPFNGDWLLLFLSSVRNFDENENLPSWLHTSECFTRNTSRMSPVVLAKRGSCKGRKPDKFDCLGMLEQCDQSARLFLYSGKVLFRYLDPELQSKYKPFLFRNNHVSY